MRTSLVQFIIEGSYDYKIPIDYMLKSHYTLKVIVSFNEIY